MARPAASRPAAPQAVAPAASAPQSTAPAAPKRRGGAWWTVLQFIIGLLVIVGVAAAVIMLYLKYYQ